MFSLPLPLPFVSVSTQLQYYKTSSRVFYCQLRRLQIYHCVQLNALFCCFWRNVEASCHKNFVVFSGNQHRRLLPAMCHNLRDSLLSFPILYRACLSIIGDPVDNTWHVAALAAGTEARQAQNRDFSLPHLHSTPQLGGFPSEYCHPVWCGKTRMVWLPDGEKKLKIFQSF